MAEIEIPPSEESAGSVSEPEQPVMSEQQLADERRTGRLAGIATLAAVALIAAGIFWTSKIDQHATGGKPVIEAPTHSGQKAGNDKKAKAEAKAEAKTKAKKTKRAEGTKQTKDDRDTVDALAALDTQSDKLVASSLAEAFGLLLLVFPALHLFRAIKARRPQTMTFLGYAAVVGPLALGVSVVARLLTQKHAASVFAAEHFSSLSAAADRADELQKQGGAIVASVVGAIGVIAFIFWLVKGVFDANKIGLLHRWFALMGAALPLLAFVFPVAPLVWLIALGGLFLGFWPGGMPPAWGAGRATQWPQRERPDREPAEIGGERNGEVDATGPGVRKRKRKRRE